MLTSNEIRQVTFDKVMRGYNVDDVIAFLDDMATQMESLENSNQNLENCKQDLEKKVYVLAEKVAEYRNDEENLKTALVNAQRLGEKVISEAKQNAEFILKEANNRAQQIEEAAKTAVEDEKLELSKIQAEVADFKNNILNLYRQHIESLSTIPEPVQPQAEPVPTFTLHDEVEPEEDEQEMVPVFEQNDLDNAQNNSTKEQEPFVDNSAVGAIFNNY